MCGLEAREPGGDAAACVASLTSQRNKTMLGLAFAAEAAETEAIASASASSRATMLCAVCCVLCAEPCPSQQHLGHQPPLLTPLFHYSILDSTCIAAGRVETFPLCLNSGLDWLDPLVWRKV